MNSTGMTPRAFVERTTAFVAASVLSGEFVEGAQFKGVGKSPVCPHPFLTPAAEFYTVARGNPKPHTLTGQALADAGMTPETWRLEITADPFTEPPGIKVPATVEKPLTLAAGNALDLPALKALGGKHGVKFVKALQCLNIAEPLGQGLWEGVPLSDVLRLCGRMNNVRRIYYSGFHNHDPKQLFQSSVSYSQAMETPPDDMPIFLAYQLNGAPISPMRGGPVRMIVPWAHGFKSIKWLQQISVTNDYRANDTYALSNNDPDAPLKTSAYVDAGPNQIPAGEPVLVTGQVIAGRSGLRRVEYWVRAVSKGARSLAAGDQELLSAPWKPCELFPPPDWKTVLPKGVSSKQLLGFDKQTGKPLSWPTRYGMASWSASLRGLKPGHYEVRARSVDLNGFAQPEPRSQLKSGKNAIDVRRFEVV